MSKLEPFLVLFPVGYLNTILITDTNKVLKAYIVKGKDRPAQLGPNIHLEFGRTVGLTLWMCEPLFSTVKAFLMDIEFFFANGIVVFESKGVYARTLIKKRWYWPKSVAGDLIDRNFSYKEAGGVDMLEAATE